MGPRSSSSRQLLQDVLREVEGFETTNDALKVELIDKEHKDGSSSDGNEQAQAQQKGIKVARKSKLGIIGKEPKSKDVEKKDTLREQEIIIKELKKKIVDIIIDDERQAHNDVMDGDRVEIIYKKGKKQAFTCAYSCTAGGGCKVDYLGPFRSEGISGTGTCFPKANGGFCIGTPRECQDCNRAI